MFQKLQDSTGCGAAQQRFWCEKARQAVRWSRKPCPRENRPKCWDQDARPILLGAGSKEMQWKKRQ
jgi:hypothetical protein